jgi:NADPH:quinone reductase-like Zn-dependent oxidoreductase
VKAMTQARYGSADVLALDEIDRPTVDEDEVLIRVRAAGVGPEVWHLMTGRPYVVRLMGVGLRRPKARVAGRDVAGIVEAVGRRVTVFERGDEVFGTCRGAFAEFACAGAGGEGGVGGDGVLAPKPANLTFEQAAGVPTSAQSALQGLRDAGGIRAGQSVLIIGASGGVGTFAVQLAKAFEAHVVGVCSPTKLDLVRSIGADHVIDYTRQDFADQTHRYDVILDTAGRHSLSHLRRALAPRGTLVIVGGEGGGRLTGGFERQLGAVVLSPFCRQQLRSLTAVDRRQDLRWTCSVSGRSSRTSEKLQSGPERLHAAGLVARQAKPGVRGARADKTPMAYSGARIADRSIRSVAIKTGRPSEPATVNHPTLQRLRQPAVLADAKSPVSKTVVGGFVHRGFESHPLR